MKDPLPVTVNPCMDFRHRVSWYAIWIKAMPSIDMVFETERGAIVSLSDMSINQYDYIAEQTGLERKVAKYAILEALYET